METGDSWIPLYWDKNYVKDEIVSLCRAVCRSSNGYTVWLTIIIKLMFVLLKSINTDHTILKLLSKSLDRAHH